MTFDCRTCGACCTSPDENRREGTDEWVEVAPDDVLLQRAGSARGRRGAAAWLVVHNAAGVAHLRLHDHRCAALRGVLGRRVTCSIYEIRPRACRRVEAGSPRCLQYRRERGVG